MQASDYTRGMRVRVQMNGVPMTYTATVVEPTPEQVANARNPEQWVWVRREDTGHVTMWRPTSLTRISA